MDAHETCPICGQSGFDTLLDHLNVHSKQDLIGLLLQQQQTTLSSLPSRSQQPSTSSISLRSGRSLQVGGNEASTSRTKKYQDRTTNLLRSTTQVSGVPPINTVNAYPLAIKSDPNRAVRREYELEFTGGSQKYNLVHVDTFPEENVTSRPSSRNSLTTIEAHEINYQEEDSQSEVVLLQSFPENSETSIRQEDTRSAEHVQEESDNATSQTSIIKYIIDQTGNENDERQGEQERWILPDGRAIPVYSSFTQMHMVSKPSTYQPTTGQIGETEDPLSNISLERHAGQVQLDLMTDEEIPPRGEISEYEESNPSSFVSEDSIRLVSLTDSRRGSPLSPVVAIELESISAKKRIKKKRRPETDRESNLIHQFLCYECPKVQKFKSLFELIGHKMRAHPSKNGCSSVGSASVAQSSSSSSMRISNIVDEKLLPKDPEEENELLDVKKQAPKKEFFCVYCKFVSNNKLSLGEHMESIHRDKPVNPTIFECTTCGKTFPARTNLRKHLLIHKERKHVCPTCSKGFTSNFKLMEHIRVHTKIYPYKCDVCEKSYRTPSLLNHHVKHAHQPQSDRPMKPKVEFYCGICHKILRSKRSFICHTQVHHAKPKKCPYCCENFIRPSVLVRHIRVAHDPQHESLESKDCPICHKKLHPNSMIKHMRIHADLKPYPCPVCGKHFRTYANLTSHSWSHTNLDKPFKCRTCPKSYLFRKNLEHHMMVHKRRTLHFVCNECGVKFTHKVNMKRHLEEHYSEKKYKCKTCGKAFQRNYYLLEHERIHTGVKPFVCNICGKASTTKSNHRAHIKIHDSGARDSGSQEG